MRILLVTPLFPPDIAEPAPYVKELAGRLSSNHAVTVLAFNHIPEEVTGVQILPIEKSYILPVRLFRFMSALIRATRDTDIIYTQNGPSVELPVLLFSLFTHKLIYVRLGDEVALAHALERPFLRLLLQFMLKRAEGIIAHTRTSSTSAFFLKNISPDCIHNIERPASRPEILPFAPYPTEVQSAYEASWSAHITELTRALSL